MPTPSPTDVRDRLTEAGSSVDAAKVAALDAGLTTLEAPIDAAATAVRTALDAAVASPSTPEPPPAPAPIPPDEPDDWRGTALPLAALGFAAFVVAGVVNRPGDSDYLGRYAWPKRAKIGATLKGGDATTAAYAYAVKPDGTRGAMIATTESNPDRLLVFTAERGTEVILGFYSKQGQGAAYSLEGTASELPEVVVTPPGNERWGFDSATEVRVTGATPDETTRNLFRALNDAGTGNKPLVVAKGAKLGPAINQTGGYWPRVGRGGRPDQRRVIRSEEKGAVDVLGRIVVAADHVELRGFRYPGTYVDASRTENAGTQHGTHVLITGSDNVRLADLLLDGAGSNLKWAHMITVTGPSDGTIYDRITARNCTRSAVIGMVGAQPRKAVLCDSWFIGCGRPKDTSVLVAQWNQGGELMNYPTRNDPSWADGGIVTERTVFDGCYGYTSQYKIGGGTYRDCVFIGADPDSFAEQGLANFRMGAGGRFIRCVSYRMFTGFELASIDGEIAESVFVDAKYAGLRLWRGNRLKDDYAPNHGWNEMLPVKGLRAHDNTFDLAAVVNNGRGASAMRLETAGEAWREDLFGGNTFERNAWLLARRDDSVAWYPPHMAGRDAWRDTTLWTRQGASSKGNEIPRHAGGLVQADPKLTRITRTLTRPWGLGTTTVPVPTPAKDSPLRDKDGRIVRGAPSDDLLKWAA